MIPTLETERLRLRAFRPEDLDAYAALNADPEGLRYLGCGLEPWDRARCFRHMAFLLGHWQLRGTGTWAVEHRATGETIGALGFCEPEGWPGLELAWRLARPWWGQGRATEGARAALDWGFGVLGRDEVISLILPENGASIRLAERLGMQLAGRAEALGNELLRYGIERERWAGTGRAAAEVGSFDVEKRSSRFENAAPRRAGLHSARQAFHPKVKAAHFEAGAFLPESEARRTG
jgi:RimJ/RimL family protein N-acetyltransferase